MPRSSRTFRPPCVIRAPPRLQACFEGAGDKPAREPGKCRVHGARQGTLDPSLGACVPWHNSAAEAAYPKSRTTHGGGRVGKRVCPWNCRNRQRPRDERKLAELSLQRGQGEYVRSSYPLFSRVRGPTPIHVRGQVPHSVQACAEGLLKPCC